MGGAPALVPLSSRFLLSTIAILLILAWKVAGYYGVDRYMLPALGTPWEPGRVFTPSGTRFGTSYDPLRHSRRGAPSTGCPSRRVRAAGGNQV